MRIKRLEIYGYGKWVDTTFDLAEDVQLFYGMNEAGKSTLMSFIHSILFGFPTRNSALLRYEPRESSRYGGKIIAEDQRFGEAIIERIHGKVTGDVTVTLEDGTTGTDELLESVLYGVDRESFQNIFSFSLSEIENVHQLGKNKLSRYLLNIGAHGTEEYLELVDQFRKEANRLYRPSGRVLALNEQLTVLEKQEQLLADLEKRNESYLGLLEKNKTENQAIKTIESKQKKQEKELNNLVEMKKKRHVYEEIQTLTAKISKVDLPPLKKDGRYLLDEYKRNLANVNEQLQTVAKKQRGLKERLKQPEILDKYEENKKAVNALENELPELIEHLRDYEAVNEKRVEVHKELTRVEQELAIEHSPSYPTTFSEIEKETVKNWQEVQAENEKDYEEMTAAIQTLENKLSLKNQRLDQYEAMMWAQEELEAAENELAGEDSEEVASNKMGPIISGLAGLIFLGGAFFVDTPLNWLLALFAALAFIITFVLFKKDTQEKASPNEFLKKEYEKQLSLKDEWREGLGEVDAMQAEYQEQLKKRDTLHLEQQKILEKWHALLEEHQLPKEVGLELAGFIFEEVERLHQLIAEDKKESHKQAELKAYLEKETAPIERIVRLEAEASLQEKVAAFRKFLNQLKTVRTTEEEKIDRLTALKQEEKRLEASLQRTREKIKDLIETASAKDEDEFVAFYKEKEAVDKKKSRLRFLKENAPDFDASKQLLTKEKVALMERNLENSLQELAKEKDQAIRQLANTQLSIENLEKDGTYTEELQVFENQKAKAQRLMDEWVSYKLAAGMIQETLNQVTQDRFLEIIADAEEYFHLLTDGEYERIVFKEEDLFVQHQEGQVVDVRVLSRGTAEPLYVAIRLAYIKNTQDMMELPIIMDDPFVNFDRKRQENMYRLLERLSEELQIIYFTFDSTAQNHFEKQQITSL